MSAFVIVEIRVEDAVGYEEYKRQAAPSVTQFGGRYIARGGAITVLEGAPPAGRVVLLEFPNSERAVEWWNSETYSPIRAIRQETATSRMFVVEGV